MAEKKMATAPTSSGTSTALAVGGVALAGVALYLATKGKTPPVTGPTAKFTPNSGEITNIIAVTGKGWSADETISSVTIGGVDAPFNLIVDDTGALNGSLTVPGLIDGSWNVIITGSVTGAITFPGAFTVKPTGGAGWIQLGTGFTAMVTSIAAYPTGWVPLGDGYTAVVTSIAAYPTGWVPLGDGYTAVVTSTTAYPSGWVPLGTGKTAAVTATTANPVGWVPLGDGYTAYVVAILPPPVYSVIVEVLPDNTAGSVSPGSGQRHYGDQITFSETPKSGYTFTGWFINGNYEGQSTSLLVTIVGNTTVSADFQLTSSNGPAFPAPSSDTSWYWVKYTDGSVGWDDVADVTDFYQHDPNSLILAVLKGPYAPGATG